MKHDAVLFTIVAINSLPSMTLFWFLLLTDSGAKVYPVHGTALQQLGFAFSMAFYTLYDDVVILFIACNK